MGFELKDKRKAMKKILFASTALAGLAIGGAASAEIALFGSARLGLGYNINNSGGIDLETGDRDGRHRSIRSPATTSPKTSSPA